MQVSVSVEGLDRLQATLHDVQDAVKQAGDGMEYAANSVLFPAVYERSISVWNVRTGHYSSSWYVNRITSETTEVGNRADYAAPLEHGWRLRGGGFRPSLGVLYVSVEQNLPRIFEVFLEWLRQRMKLS